MRIDGELAVVYEHGVLQPENELPFPEHTRLVIAIRRVETSPKSEDIGRQMLQDIRHRGVIRLESWRPRRDEMHERG